MRGGLTTVSEQVDAFFENLNSAKQEKFEVRVCNALLKYLGASALQIAALRREAEEGASKVTGFTPEWLSERISSPVIFRAVKDQNAVAEITNFNWFLTHRIDGYKSTKFWRTVWEETIDRHGANTKVCVCFTAPWATVQLCLHNYTNALQHTPSAEYPVEGTMLTWNTKHTQLIMQPFKDFVNILRFSWTPAI